MKPAAPNATPVTENEPRPREWARFYPLVLFVVGWLVYVNSFSGPFIFDDTTSVFNNPYMKKLWPLSYAMKAPPQTTAEPRPVVCLSLAINYAISGLNTWSYHALNLLTHLLNAILIYFILRRTLREKGLGERFASESAGLAFIIALLWVTHPLLTDAVDYVIQRTELMMAFFLLLTLYCVIRGARSPYRLTWYVSAIVACELGMGSKEIMVVAPLLVLLYDRIFLVSSWREVWRERWWVYGGFVCTGLILYMVTKYAHRVTVGFDVGLTPWDYLKTQAGVVAYYLRLSFWPSPLSLDYDDWPIAKELVSVLPQGILIVALLVATAWALARKPALGFLGAWFFLILAPTSSILPIVTEIVGERRMYLSLAALVTLVVVGVYVGCTELERRRSWPKQVWRRVGAWIVVGVVAGYGFLTLKRNFDFRSEIAIWSDTVKKRPQNIRARSNLINQLTQAKREEEAIGHLHVLLKKDANNIMVHNQLGALYLKKGATESAYSHFFEVVRISPASPHAHNNLGAVLVHQGKLDEAIGQFQEALRLKPDYEEAKKNLVATLALRSHPKPTPPNPPSATPAVVSEEKKP